MKTQQLHNLILVTFLFISAFSFFRCGDSEVNGCTNAFATNFNSTATVDCCCEYDEEALIDELVGKYDFKIDNSDLTKNFTFVPVTLIKDPDDNTGFIITDYWIQDIYGSFSNGKFVLSSDVDERFGCSSKTEGNLIKENNTLLLDLEHREWGIKEPPSQIECGAFDFVSEGELIKH